jgi:lipopolysaccharide assembly outer membrane protein LptD (OstA)
MPLSRKSAMLALAAALGTTQVVAQKADAKKPDKGAKVGKLDPNAEEPLELPIPKGQPQKGVKVPLYGANGKLKMNFEIGIGTYIDEEHVKLEKLRVETFREDGTQELDMDLPDAVYNKKTKVISSQTRVVIKRSDFEVTGNTMAFNIETREGILGGGVKMIISNLGETTGTADKPAVEFHLEPADSKSPTDKKAPK